jgi:hypothetical protein
LSACWLNNSKKLPSRGSSLPNIAGSCLVGDGGESAASVTGVRAQALRNMK